MDQGRADFLGCFGDDGGSYGINGTRQRFVFFSLVRSGIGRGVHNQSRVEVLNQAANIGRPRKIELRAIRGYESAEPRQYVLKVIPKLAVFTDQKDLRFHRDE